MRKLTDEEKKTFWRKLFGFTIGEEITVTYELPLRVKRQKIGTGELFLAGKVVEIRAKSIILETSKGVRISLDEERILDARLSNEEDKQKLRLLWGETLDGYLKRTQKKISKKT